MKKEFDFFDKEENIKILQRCFYFLLFLLVILDIFVEKHPHYGWENLFGAYALYGFFSCVLIVIVSKFLGKLWLQKPEDYYDRGKYDI
ncbi:MULTISPECIES: hypothetical protein [Calditerrivibrio]|uniref:2TM domain-containing protein n=1 Tax=Calditerrivibrio nitroreducens TaxID=477976 RepID=A0A2J6WI65_9BACT|nr:MAG: hypothetical protein C0187_05895 [Calditerrivibrio nitroreducens]